MEEICAIGRSVIRLRGLIYRLSTIAEGVHVRLQTCQWPATRSAAVGWLSAPPKLGKLNRGGARATSSLRRTRCSPQDDFRAARKKPPDVGSSRYRRLRLRRLRVDEGVVTVRGGRRHHRRDVGGVSSASGSTPSRQRGIDTHLSELRLCIQTTRGGARGGAHAPSDCGDEPAGTPTEHR